MCRYLLDRVHARSEKYACLGIVGGVMLVFSAFLTHFEDAFRASDSVVSHPSNLVRFCVLVLCFLWLLFGLTAWASRNEGEDNLIGTSTASSQPGATALAAIVTFVELRFVGIGWNAVISHQHLQSRSTQFFTISNDRQAILFLFTAISAGFVEEYVFRGYLQRRFTKLTRSVWTGALLQLGFFTLAHLYQGPSGLLSVFLLGIVLTLTAVTRRTLVPGMIAHALGDALGPLTFLAHHVMRGAVERCHLVRFALSDRYPVVLSAGCRSHFRQGFAEYA